MQGYDHSRKKGSKSGHCPTCVYRAPKKRYIFLPREASEAGLRRWQQAANHAPTSLLSHMLETLLSEASEPGRDGGVLRRRRRCPKRAAPGDDPQKTCAGSPTVRNFPPASPHYTQISNCSHQRSAGASACDTLTCMYLYGSSCS